MKCRGTLRTPVLFIIRYAVWWHNVKGDTMSGGQVPLHNGVNVTVPHDMMKATRLKTGLESEITG